MKKNSLLLLTILLVGFASSCSDQFLDQPPISAFNESVLTTGAGVTQALTGAYVSLRGSGGMNTSPLSPLMGSIHGGEAHKGSSAGDASVMLDIEKSAVPTTNTNIRAFWVAYFEGIYRCNLVIKALPDVKDLTDAQKASLGAEARFLRAHFHFYLKRAFKNIPFIDEKATDVRVPNFEGTDVTSGTYTNAWPLIAADMDFARKNLPATQTQIGRPNKWAAEAYYARILIYRGNEGEKADAYTEAKDVLATVIASGVTSSGTKYALLPNYHDNFNADKENNSESVFAVQTSVNDAGTTAGQNGSPDGTYMGVYRNASTITGFGFFLPSQWFVDHFRTDANGLPYLDDATRIANTVKNDDGVSPTTAFTPDAGPLDPRLDWNVGRRGIPFYDFGLMAGASWLREPAFDGPYVSKKWHHYKKDEGKHTAPNTYINDINMPIIRYSDVLLLAAEVEARVGDLGKARDYVNQVRNRMVQNTTSPDNWVKNLAGTDNAANYKISLYPAGSPAFASKDEALKAILFERTLELGLEGSRFFDLVRFNVAAQEINAYFAFEGKSRSHLTGAGVQFDAGRDEYLPIPNDAVINSQKAGQPTLKQNPGY